MLLTIVLLPFLGFLINASFGRRVSKAAAGAVACGAMLGSFAIAVLAVLRLVPLDPGARAIVERGVTWIASRDFPAAPTPPPHPPAPVMVLLVTGTGSPIPK